MDHEKVKAIFTEAAALGSAEERAACLDSACAGDSALRKQVESLLADQDQLGNFLETPLLGPEPADAPAVIGTRIGPYKILEQIGEGGFGTVYMAEQEQPVRRKVALKIIKAGMDTKQVIARFEAERQALAMMDHPNIARVFEAGTTDPHLASGHPLPSDGRGAGGEGASCLPSGRPYFVMELVKGIPITEFCDQKKLSTARRLDLFIKVCNAVQHAHQKGIIHRDLKPSNVMITMVDGQPVPKVIDFGVAKAIEQKLTEKTLFTRYGQMIGTPAYMSPEQAELSGQDVDTRSDIYSLGCLLYELLTGTAPIEKETLRKAGLDEVRRLIRDTDPPKPSTRLNSKSEIRNLKSEIEHVRGDLDRIAMKCLEKDRNRRYETVNGLAMDLQRHLNHEPVVARPPSRLYQFQKFVRRNQLQVVFTASVMAALIFGLVFTLIGFREARRERDRAVKAEQQAEANEQLAKTEAARSAQVAQFMKDMLKGVEPRVALGRDTTMLREILDQTATRLETLTNQPAVEADLRVTLGNVYSALGEYAKAEAMLRKALNLRRKLNGDEDLATADVLGDLGASLWRQNNSDPEAETLMKEALGIRRRLLGNDHSVVAGSLSMLGNVLYTRGKLAEAETVQREALAIRQILFGPDHSSIAFSLNNLGYVLTANGKVDEAEEHLRKALKLRIALLGEDHFFVADTLFNLGILLQARGNLRGAEESLRESLTIKRKQLGSNHLNAADSLAWLASVLLQQGRYAEAEEPSRECLQIHEMQPSDYWRRLIARTLLGTSLLAQEKFADAERLLIECHDGLNQRGHEVPDNRKPQLKKLLQSLVQLYEETNRPEKVAEWQQKLAELEKTDNPAVNASSAAEPTSK